jgi:hypothetical protein
MAQEAKACQLLNDQGNGAKNYNKWLVHEQLRKTRFDKGREFLTYLFNAMAIPAG